MSYLSLPRLTFAGEFQADVPTANNDADFVNLPAGTEPPVGGLNWNPIGSGAFRLLNCTVRAVRTDESADATSDSDPITRAQVGGSNDRVSAKIVDLDPQFQSASELWGLRVSLDADGVTLLAGDFEPAGFRDFGGGATLSDAHARYQSVLRNLSWAPPGTSGFVDRLRAATTEELLSVRLTTLAFGVEHFTIGTMLGALGPYLSGEPRRFVAGRRFAPLRANTVINEFDGELSPTGTQLSLDLSNAIPMSGKEPDLGQRIRFGVLTNQDAEDGTTVAENLDFVGVGEALPELTHDWLVGSGGLVTLPVPIGASDLIDDHPLAMLTNETSPAVLIREDAGGWLARTDREVLRAAPGDSASMRVHVRQFGRPVEGVQLSATVRPVPGQPGTGTPPEALALDQLAPTGQDGTTELRMTCTDPGKPRGEQLDGQLYEIRLSGRMNTVVVLVFSGYPIPDNPTWDEHILPIFRKYADLYPIMTKRLIDLSSYQEVRERKDILELAFSLDIGDPNSMPVTRDLSPNKRATIRKWLARSDLPRADVPREPEIAPPSARTFEAAIDVSAADAPFIIKHQVASQHREQTGWEPEA